MKLFKSASTSSPSSSACAAYGVHTPPRFVLGSSYLHLLKCFMGLFLGTVLIGCNGGKNSPNIELMQDMMEQNNLKSQDYDQFRKEGSNRVPPEGTVPRGFTPYQYAGDALTAEAKLVNPLAGVKFDSSIEVGKAKYNIYCSVCHGLTGQGDGNVAPYLALKPPALVTDKVKAFNDGRIFHIITDGQGVMSTYATQIHKVEDRWAIVNYIRTLQKNK
jgi:mono/diheme cytochrome c family protein